MNLQDLPRVGQQFEIGLRPSDAMTFGTVLESHSEAKLQVLHSTNETILTVGALHWPIVGLDERNQRLLDNLLFDNWPRLCWISVPQPKEQVTAQIYLTGRSFVHMHTLSPEAGKPIIGLSDRLFEELRTRVIRKSQMGRPEILQWLVEHLVVKTAGASYFLISAGLTTTFDTSLTSFRIHGHQIALDVDRTQNLWRIDKLIRTQKSDPDQAVLLIQGHLDFQDLSVAGQMETSGQTELDAIVKQSAGSYLGIWKEYNKIERDILVDRALRMGWLDYQKCWVIPDGWRLQIKNAPGNRHRLEEMNNQEEIDLEVATDLPQEISPDTSDAAEVEEDITSIDLPRPKASGLPVQCIGIDSERLTMDIRPLNPDDVKSPPERGFVFVSISGDRYRLRRREFAWQRVRFLKTPIPGLGLLLERSEKFLTRDYKPQSIKLSIMRDAFQDEPTERQRAAIRVALNTPDIALIQGPPGTGKTKVITALNKILINDKTAIKAGRGETLLTSYQHDAVENVASRSEVLGLPAIKLGRRHFQEQGTDPSNIWRQKLIHQLLNDPERSLSTPVSAVLHKVQTLLRGYMKAPLEAKVAAQMLREIFSDAYAYLSNDLQESLISLSRQIEHGVAQPDFEADAEQQKILQAVRSLRIEAVAFADDGPRNARILLRRLENQPLLTPEEIELLQAAADWVDDTTSPEFLPRLSELQSKIVDRYIAARQLDLGGLVNADVESLLTQVIDALYQYACQNPGDASEIIVRRFISDLENDPQGAYRTLQDYSFVLAATCQQSVGQSMQRLKLGGTQGETVEFETVIVDEASRANPLDLLIPMSLSRRRIILVGDHRQLPHMLEHDVEHKLNQSNSETQEILRLSLFERLFRHLQDLEKQDGTQRTITLDRQYRMHPVLGEFVSDTFYKPYGEGFRSDHLNPVDFAHDIESFRGKTAVWINIPIGRGRESGVQSKYRLPEASWIAKEARRILDANPNYSVGVITFYAAQVQKILREMARPEIHLVEQKADGVLQIRTAYLQGPNGDERLRVGTVDAFQGKEFDIVLLSLVRSNDERANLENETAWRGKYGFLTLENRLCVAMSRQKRLLIVVGDEAMVSEPAAPKVVHGLVAFHTLCGGPDGVRLSL